MYPLGITGAPKINVQTEVTDRFKELDQWIPHIRSLGCNAIYIGPLFESSSHGYDTRDYKLVDRRLGTNDDFREFTKLCHENGIKVSFSLLKISRKRNGTPLTKTGTKG